MLGMSKDVYATRQEKHYNMRYVGYNLSSDGGSIAHSMKDNGYAVVRCLLDEDDVRIALGKANSLMSKHENYGFIYEPGGKCVRSIFAPHNLDETLFAISRNEDAVGHARSILESDVYIHQGRINFKFIGGLGWGWHSDFETWHAEDGMPGMSCLTMMLALTNNTKTNGALMVIPGSHKHYISCPGKTPVNNWEQSLVNQVIGVPSDEIIMELKGRCNSDEESLYLNAGDAVFFHCNLMHKSMENTSHKERINLFYAYNSIANSLDAPFSAVIPRPEYAGHRVVTPYC